MREAFWITIRGVAEPEFLGVLLEQVKQITPEDGSFVFRYGRTAGGCTCSVSPSSGRRWLDDECTIHTVGSD